MKNNPVVVSIIVAVVVGAAAFFGGMKYQQSQTPAGGQFAGRSNGQGRPSSSGGRFGNGGRPVMGDILSVDDKSVTVKMSDGSTKIVILSASTSINKAAEATKTDLTVGTRVGVFGMQNSDGSVTAQNIQINPISRSSFGATPSAEGK
jgi:hypothetical protein